MTSRIKYANGAYQTTSKAQDKLWAGLFSTFRSQWGEHFTGCLQNFDNWSGDCQYTFTFDNPDRPELVITITRGGTII